MSEYTALLAGGVVLAALFDAYAYYRFKYAERALDVAKRGESAEEKDGERAGDGAELDSMQKTLADEIADEESAEAIVAESSYGGGRKPLAQRLREIDGEREARRGERAEREAREAGVFTQDSAVLFEPSGNAGAAESADGAVVEKSFAASEAGDGFGDSLAALRASIKGLKGALRIPSSKRFKGSAGELGDASDGASFSSVDSGDYGSGDYGVVSS